jgi:hypothetical protein
LTIRAWCLLFFFGLAASASAQSNFNRFNFSAGGGLGIGRGFVNDFVGNSYFGQVGGGVNLNRLFGFDAEYMYYNLSFRPSVKDIQSLPGASGNLQSISLDGLFYVPYHPGRWGFYGIYGGGFYRRSVSATTQVLAAGSFCEPAWSRWFGIQCVNGVVQPQQTLSSFTKNAGGFNVGGGITFRLNHLHHAKIFAEGRYHRAYQSDGETSFIPITVGLRW